MSLKKQLKRITPRDDIVQCTCSHGKNERGSPTYTLNPKCPLHGRGGTQTKRRK